MSEQTSLIKKNRSGIDPEFLMDKLASKNNLTREKAREALIALGKPAVPSLIRTLENSELNHLRWEAAKILGSIEDKRASGWGHHRRVDGPDESVEESGPGI